MADLPLHTYQGSRGFRKDSNGYWHSLLRRFHGPSDTLRWGRLYCTSLENNIMGTLNKSRITYVRLYCLCSIKHYQELMERWILKKIWGNSFSRWKPYHIWPLSVDVSSMHTWQHSKLNKPTRIYSQANECDLSEIVQISLDVPPNNLVTTWWLESTTAYYRICAYCSFLRGWPKALVRIFFIGN